MFMTVPVVVMMVRTLEQPGAHQIHDQPDGRDTDGLVEMNRLRGKEAMDRLPCHEQCDDRQHHGAGEASQNPHLARAKAVVRVARVTPAEMVSQGRDEERGDMRAHVPAVGQQRH
jgi:hypothetical protein